MIGAFPEGETGAAFDAYTAAANGLRGDYDFGHTTDASLLAEAKGGSIATLRSDAYMQASRYKLSIARAACALHEGHAVLTRSSH